MANSNPASSAPAAEVTFRSFTGSQGKNYADHRLTYNPKLYQIILDHHASGGKFDTLVDVGCGPGMAVRDLAAHFDHAFGLDASEGMIKTALSLGGVTSSSEPIRFHVSPAEDLGKSISPPIPDGSVDLITAATAAHWFDMAAFWKRAAELLKPGGTVAIWTGGQIRADPTMENHQAVQAALDKLQERVEEYMAPGNRLNNELYVDLPLPWNLATPVPDFDEASFLRKEWGTGGDSEPGDQFHAIQRPIDLNALEMVMGTASPVVRWREAHPEAVNTEQDVVRMMRREIEKSYRDIGVPEGQEILKGGVEAVLLLVKKKDL